MVQKKYKKIYRIHIAFIILIMLSRIFLILIKIRSVAIDVAFVLSLPVSGMLVSAYIRSLAKRSKSAIRVKK